MKGDGLKWGAAWDRVCTARHPAATPGGEGPLASYTERMRVPGGWVVRTTEFDHDGLVVSADSVFVPWDGDPNDWLVGGE